MENKIKWQREDNGSSVPYMFEETQPNKWIWIRYTSSKVYIKDKGSSFSRGYLSFLNAIKLGYTVVYPQD